MEVKIVLLDRKRGSNSRGCPAGFIAYTGFWVVRYGLKSGGIQSATLDWALGICLALTIPAMFYLIIRMDSLRGQARTDSGLGGCHLSFYRMERG
jgi:hypothetical protein